MSNKNIYHVKGMALGKYLRLKDKKEYKEKDKKLVLFLVEFLVRNHPGLQSQLTTHLTITPLAITSLVVTIK